MKLKKKFIKQLVDSRPDIEKHHGMPMTRRDLLAQGYISGASMIAMPSLLSIVSQQALGAECETGAKAGSSKTAVLIIDAAGGFSPAGRNVVVGGELGQKDFLPVGSYESIGLLPEADYRAGGQEVKEEFGLAFANVSPVYEGMMNMTSTEARAKIDGGIFCVRSNNDTGNNPFNPVKWLVKAGANGTVVPIVGTEDSDYGGNSTGPANSLYVASRPVRVTSPQGAVGLVLPGVLAEISNNDTAFVKKVFDAMKTMSERQIKKFNDLPAQVQASMLCSYAGATAQATSFDASMLDPTQDTNITDVFGANPGRAGSLAKVILDGYVGAGVLRIGGCDYHNNNVPNNVIPKDREIGTAIGGFLEVAHRKGVDAHVIVFTDGSTGASGGNADAASGINGPTSDSGTRSAIFSLTYKAGGSGRIGLNLSGRQVGRFGTSGEVERTNLISDSVSTASEALVANYIALHTPKGQDPAAYISSELKRVIGQDTFGKDLMDYIIYKSLLA